MEYLFTNIPEEINIYILSYLNIKNLTNISQVNKYSNNLINKLESYINPKKFYQYLSDKNNIKPDNYPLYLKYFLTACQESEIYTIKYLSEKYNLIEEYGAGFMQILKTNNPDKISWYCDYFNLSKPQYYSDLIYSEYNRLFDSNYQDFSIISSIINLESLKLLLEPEINNPNINNLFEKLCFIGKSELVSWLLSNQKYKFDLKFLDNIRANLTLSENINYEIIKILTDHIKSPPKSNFYSKIFLVVYYFLTNNKLELDNIIQKIIKYQYHRFELFIYRLTIFINNIPDNYKNKNKILDIILKKYNKYPEQIYTYKFVPYQIFNHLINQSGLNIFLNFQDIKNLIRILAIPEIFKIHIINNKINQFSDFGDFQIKSVITTKIILNSTENPEIINYLINNFGFIIPDLKSEKFLIKLLKIHHWNTALLILIQNNIITWPEISKYIFPKILIKENTGVFYIFELLPIFIKLSKKNNYNLSEIFNYNYLFKKSLEYCLISAKYLIKSNPDLVNQISDPNIYIWLKI